MKDRIDEFYKAHTEHGNHYAAGFALDCKAEIERLETELSKALSEIKP